MDQFTIYIHNPYLQARPAALRGVGILHFATGFLLANAWLDSYLNQQYRGLGYLFLVMALFEAVYAFFAGRQLYRHPRLNGIIRITTAFAFLVYAVVQFSMDKALFGIFMVLIAGALGMVCFIERRWTAPYEVRVGAGGVWFPHLFKARLLDWDQFNHLILRDNLLTMDMRSNRVLQLELERPVPPGTAEAFNAFCAARTGVR